MAARTCPRCGEPLPTDHGNRKWCSGRCRRAACEEAARPRCVDCGGPRGKQTAWDDSEHCIKCHRKRMAIVQRARIEDVAEMYREGMPMKEIAATLGYKAASKPWEVTAAFRLGILTDADRRYPKERAERAANARWAALERSEGAASGGAL